MQKTTKITLTFSEDIIGLSLGDIFYSPGQTGSKLNRLESLGNGVYELYIDNIERNGRVQVSLLKDGYNIRNPDGVFKFIEIFNGKDWYEGDIGTGTAADPFIIHNETTLKQVGTGINIGTGAWSATAKYKQICDIELDQPEPGKTGNFTPLNLLPGGEYDGGGYIVKDIIMSSTGRMGFFRINTAHSSTSTATAKASSVIIKNLGLVNLSITGGGESAGLATTNDNTYGYKNAVRIYRCFVMGSINGGSNSYISGIMARMTHSSVEDCFFIGNVTGAARVAGISANSSACEYSKCFTMGKLTGTTHVGAITSYQSTHIYSCVALNNGVLRSSGTNTYVHRIQGRANGTRGKNYAERNMVLIEKNPPVNDIGTDSDENGKSILPELYLNPNWWKDASNWQAGHVWDFSDNGPWEWDNENLRPSLKRGKPPIEDNIEESE